MAQKKGAEAYLCLWDPTHQLVNIEHSDPKSSQIIQDMELIRNETYIQIYNKCGVTLEGCIERKKRKEVGPGRGGERKRSKDYEK
eukprot:11383257-Ditylum_brightwellii.AAC.1